MDDRLGFETRVEQRGAALVVAPSGDIDMATAPQVTEAIVSADGSTRRTVLDLRDVTFMDTSGLQVLITAQRHVDAQRGELVIVRGSGSVDRVIEIAGLADRLRIVPTLDAALGEDAR